MLKKLSQLKSNDVLYHIYKKYKKTIIFYIIMLLVYFVVLFLIHNFNNEYLFLSAFLLTIINICAGLDVHDKYRNIKSSLLVYIIEHDIMVKRIVLHGEQIFCEVLELHSRFSETKAVKDFPYVIIEYLRSEAHGELFLEEIKRYPLFTDMHCISFGLLNLYTRKISPKKLMSIKMLEIKEQILKESVNHG